MAVLVVGERLSKIVEPRPHKFAQNKWIVVLGCKLFVRLLRPWRALHVVAGNLGIVIPGIVPLADGEHVFSARTYGRGGFASIENHVRFLVVIFFVVERLVVKTLQIEGVGKTVADCVAVPIHSGCDRTCRIQRADYVGEPFQRRAVRGLRCLCST